MNPSQYQLPQLVSADRQRAREGTLSLERARLTILKDDLGVDDAAPDFRRLPPSVEKLPADLDYPLSHISVIAAQRGWTKLVEVAARASSIVAPLSSERGYQRLYRLMRGQLRRVAAWRDDAEFGRQRMTGVNPMSLRLVRELESTELFAMAAETLRGHPMRRKVQPTLDDLVRGLRLFDVDYGVLLDARVQKHVRAPAVLTAPRCVFWQDEFGDLMPLAMQMWPAREGLPPPPVVGPLSPASVWMLARSHFQAADTHLHEAPYHLLETHLVSGAVALCMYRHLHPDHPIRQLLDPHYAYTLAINKLALGDLLAPGGTIDRTVAAGVAGALNGARIYYSGWDFSKRSLEADLESRGLDRAGVLPHYYYRDDARRLAAAIEPFAESMLRLWYRTDEDVAQDYELQAFLTACASKDGGDIPGFPERITTQHQLFRLIADLIFRAGPQHAAVNNGQFDAYGWIPGTPGKMAVAFPSDHSSFTEADLWEAMPDTETSIGQMGMVWVLSRPTIRSILHAGEAPAFHPKLCFEADDIIGAFRRRLSMVSADIQARNERLEQPYVYLDPLNISRSTDI